MVRETKVRGQNKQQDVPKIMVLDGKGNTMYYDLLDYPIKDNLRFGDLINMFLDMEKVGGSKKFIAVQEDSKGNTINAIPIHRIIEDQTIPKNITKGFHKVNERNIFEFDKIKFANERRK